MDLSLFCLRAFVKRGQDREYYDILELSGKSPTTEEIKKAYKKASLNYHPDKLAQRGIAVTPEIKQKFVKVTRLLN
jgi:DnaJ-class molecular chaperone